MGQPLVLRPSGVHLRATLGRAVGNIRRTWLTHRHLIFLTSSVIGLVAVLLCSSVFRMVSRQKKLRILRRHLFWKTSGDRWSCSSSRVLLYTKWCLKRFSGLILVFVLMLLHFYVLLTAENAWLAFEIIVFICTSVSPLVVMLEPRSAKSSMSSISSPFSTMAAYVPLFILRCFVFLVLIFSPICPAVLTTSLVLVCIS